MVFSSATRHFLKIRLVLIINGHKKEWLPPMQDVLRTALHVTAQTFALGPNAVIVMNHEMAESTGLISVQ